MSASLYVILLLQVKGKALDQIKCIKNGEGCKAWQTFEEDYDPKVRTKRADAGRDSEWMSYRRFITGPGSVREDDQGL